MCERHNVHGLFVDKRYHNTGAESRMEGSGTEWKVGIENVYFVYKNN